MAFYEDIFLGVKTGDMKLARKICEELIGAPLKCTNGTFYGGDHCHTVIDGTSFQLRLNHFDDGDGYRWCIEDAKYPLVFTCSFRSQELKQRILNRVAQSDLIELPKDGT